LFGIKKSMNFRLADPEFVNFVPATATEAVLKFRRLEKQGLHPAKYPEALIECAQALSAEEQGKFEDWIVCPQGAPGKECIDVEYFSKENRRIHDEMVAAIEDVKNLSISEESDEKAPH